MKKEELEKQLKRAQIDSALVFIFMCLVLLVFTLLGLGVLLS